MVQRGCGMWQGSRCTAELARCYQLPATTHKHSLLTLMCACLCLCGPLCVSPGEGKPRMLDEKETTVYKRALDMAYNLKIKSSRAVYGEVRWTSSARQQRQRWQRQLMRRQR